MAISKRQAANIATRIDNMPRRSSMFKFPYGPGTTLGHRVLGTKSNAPIEERQWIRVYISNGMGHDLRSMIELDHFRVMGRHYPYLNYIGIGLARHRYSPGTPLIPIPGARQRDISPIAATPPWTLVKTPASATSIPTAHGDSNIFMAALELEIFMVAPINAFDNQLAHISDNSIVKLSAHIYEHLWANEGGSVAVFRVLIETENHNAIAYPGIFNPFESRSRIAPSIRVRLTRRPLKSANAEIFYIASIISKFLVEYIEDNSENRANGNFVVTGVSGQQLIMRHVARFSPVIRGRQEGADELLSRLENSNKLVNPATMKNLRKWLGPNRMLTSPKTTSNCVMLAIHLAINNIDYAEVTKKDRHNMTSLISARKVALKIGKNPSLSSLATAIQRRKRPWLRGIRLHILGICLEPLTELPITNAGINVLTDKYVIVLGRHALAVVEKRDTIIEDAKLITRLDVPKVSTEFIGFWDMETTTTMNPYMVGFTSNDGETVNITVGIRCVPEFLYALSKYTAKRMIFYAHNGGKFDTPILMKHLPNSWKIIGILTHANGRVLSLKIMNLVTKTFITFKDTFPLMPASLDSLSKTYNVEHGKLTGTVDHSKMTDLMWSRADLPSVKRYLKYDVLALKEVSEAFAYVCIELYGINPFRQRMLTGPSISKWVFISKYYDELKYPLYHLSDKITKHVRAAYHGGRTEVGWRKRENGVVLNYYDLVSQYPTTMITPLPYGVPKYHVFDDGLLPDDFLGFVQILVVGGEGSLMTLRVRSHHRGLISPSFENPTKIWLYSEELRFVIRNNDITKYRIRVIRGWEFKHGPYLAEITQKFFEIKTAAKKMGKAQYQAAKARLNSIYGHFVFRESGKQMVVIESETTFMHLVSTGELVSRVGNLALIEGKIETHLRYVPTGAAITAKAYVMLMQNVINIHRAGFKTYYTDTDSLVTDAPAHIIEKAQPIGLKLGYMELELGNIIDAVFVTAKVYALRAENDGIITDIVKIKGVARGPYKYREDNRHDVLFRERVSGDDGYFITFEDICNLLEGKKIRVCSFRVFGGRDRLLHSEGVEARTPTIEITGNYIKGNQSSSGEILPLTGI